MKFFSRALILLLPALLAGSAGAAEDSDTLLWKEELRAFLQDGPGWLLSEERRQALLEVDEEERQAWVDSFLAEDPDTGTEVNELIEGIDRRRRLVEDTLLSFLDVRSRLLFLHGSPIERILISCDQTFVPIEIWWYDDPKESRGYVLYEPEADAPYRLWLPVDSKRVLYNHEMEYWLEQVAEIRGFGRGPRFDKTLCKQTKLVDEATGVKGLFDYEKARPKNEEILEIVTPPDDLRVWAKAAASTPLSAIARLSAAEPEVFFPELDRGRMLVRLLVRIPAEAGLEVYEDNEKRQLRVKVEGVVERQGETFEEFHMRFQVPVEGEAEELALVLDRRLRPEEVFLVRLRIIDEISEAQTTKAIAFTVPRDPVPHAELPLDILVAHGADFQPEKAAKADSLFLIPPETDVVLGLWKAETLITGTGIVKVAFFIDGKQQFSRSRPPFHAELRLSKYPTEHIIRVEGYDGGGELLAWDEAVLNQQRGRLELRIGEPAEGAQPSGPTLVRAGIVVPEEKKIDKVEFLVDDQLLETLTRPPWHVTLDLPRSSSAGVLHYVTVAVVLEDGTRAEDVRFLSQPDYLEEVDVDFVELYTSVDGDAARSLQQADFTILEDKRPQQIRKFELVVDLPLTIGITIDTSGSMIEALGEAKRSAIGFLDNIITPKDQSFAVSFASRPNLVMPRTSDVGAVEAALEGLRAVGNTSLYDAVITSLYYFRGVRGRRALVLLSDGDDTSSTISFKDSLEYARRSGVVIYTIGLNISRTAMGIRGKLGDLSRVTGGRSFFISNSVELTGVYDAIEDELRSQYLLAYLSDAPQASEIFRTVEVKVKGRLKARTISGYYP